MKLTFRTLVRLAHLLFLFPLPLPLNFDVSLPTCASVLIPCLSSPLFILEFLRMPFKVSFFSPVKMHHRDRLLCFSFLSLTTGRQISLISFFCTFGGVTHPYVTPLVTHMWGQTSPLLVSCQNLPAFPDRSRQLFLFRSSKPA